MNARTRLDLAEMVRWAVARVGAAAQERRVIVDKEIEPAANLAGEDQGIGIPAEKLPRIFDDYYRADTISVALFAERSVRSRYEITYTSLSNSLRLLMPFRYVSAQLIL